MSSERYVEAKKMFDKYNGSYFQMEREGEYRKYKQFSIPPEVEGKWNHELKMRLVNSLQSTITEKETVLLFSQYGDLVSQTKDERGLLFMRKFASENQGKLDTYTNVRIVETILNSVNRFNLEMKQSTIRESLKLLKLTAKSTFYVSDSYKENGSFPNFTSESIVIDRINRNILYWEQELKSL